MNPYGSFLVIHFEVGGNTRSLEYQEEFWPAAVDLIHMADEYEAKLTLQFTPQWREYILRDQNKLDLVRRWQKHGHELGLHHHGCDHGDWDGYTNRVGKEVDPKFRGSIQDMMKLVWQFVGADQLVSGTITDEKLDYPKDITYDTEGIRIYHARRKPKRVSLGGNNIIQVGIALLSWEGDIESFKREYQKSKGNEVFGVVTHEKDFAKNPAIIEKWMRFVRSRGMTIKTVSQIITEYQKSYAVKYSDKPLTFLNDVMGTVTPSVTEGKGCP
ncbi:MAG: hypothetical protein KKH11_02840 [Candidatus Omnitrophica bacterium]|nr:hypothetical protein [Candidatus Omnitrophota bacterium]